MINSHGSVGDCVLIGGGSKCVGFLTFPNGSSAPAFWEDETRPYGHGKKYG